MVGSGGRDGNGKKGLRVETRTWVSCILPVLSLVYPICQLSITISWNGLLPISLIPVIVFTAYPESL